MRRLEDERGAVLIVALMALALMAALGAALVMVSSSETAVALNFRRAAEARYAAEAALERAVGELQALPVWTDVPSGAVLSSFVDGSPSGVRRLPGNAVIDLTEVRNRANCEQRTGCTSADLDRQTPERPWGALNPRWQLFGYGPLPLLSGGQAAGSPLYVVMLVADDPNENDGNPEHDGLVTGVAPNPGRQVLVVRAEAYGLGGVHAITQATVARIDTEATASAPAWSEVRVMAQREGG